MQRGRERGREGERERERERESERLREGRREGGRYIYSDMYIKVWGLVIQGAAHVSTLTLTLQCTRLCVSLRLWVCRFVFVCAFVSILLLSISSYFNW